MSNRPKILLQAEVSIRDQEIELLDHRERILRFIRTEHTAEENLKLRDEVIECQLTLDRFLKALTLNKNIDVAFRVEAENICARWRALNDYTNDIFSHLNSDLILRQRAEEKITAEAKKTTTDYAMKISALFGLPAVLMGIVDKLGGSKANVGEAAGAGIAITGVYFYKDLKNDKNLKGLAAKIPALLEAAPKNIYYIMPLMNARIGMMLSYRMAADIVGKRVTNTSQRTGRLIAKFSKKTDPKF